MKHQLQPSANQTEPVAPFTASSIASSTRHDAKTAADQPIAIIGMGCRFPGPAGQPVTTPAAFWQLLRSGADIAQEIPADRWDVDAYYDPTPDTPGKMYVRQGYFLEEIDGFDAQFFGLAAREVAAMDPQQRLLLETSWEALEAAGIAPAALAGSQTGVFISSFWDDYSSSHLYGGVPEAIDRYTILSNLRPMAAGRLAHLLGVHGPNLQVDTACSAALTALHLACQSLRNQECDLAFAGGVYLLLTPEMIIGLCQMGALAADGRSKAFDRSANGFAIGEGCGMVLLKRLADAQADGDPICAVIRGSALNHDGQSRTVTTPNGQAQRDLLRQALAQAGVNPAQVDYVETHGTGTELGDPIEVLAIADAYCQGRPAPLAIGSVKSNIGHLNAAAGMAGLFKIILALQNEELPPTLHVNQLNPRIPWAKLGITVPTAPTPWPAQGAPRQAGLSAFGLSGSNAHVIIEEAPREDKETRRQEDKKTRRAQLFTLSAQSGEALKAYARHYAVFLAEQPTLDLGDLCYTAQVGRSHFPHRLSITCATIAQLQEKLNAYLQGEIGAGVCYGIAPTSTKTAKAGADGIAFLFTGQGSQYVNMGRELYATQPTFRAILDRCDAILRGVLGRSLIELLYPETAPQHNDLLESHPCGQAANFALECALVDLWCAWGVKPNLVLGHSLGDFAAAYCAGVLSLEDGLRLVVERGHLMEEALGSMVSVLASEAEVAPFIATFADVTIGVINGPASVVISGGQTHVTQATLQLQQAGFKTRKLDIPVAAHSPMLDPVLDRFEAAVRKVKLSLPTCTVVSSMTGQIVKSELTDPVYWRNHLRNTVRFADGMTTLQQQGCTIFLEVGPKPTLLGMAQQMQAVERERQEAGEIAGCHPSPSHPFALSPCLFLPTLREGQSDWRQMLESLGAVYGQGVNIDWQGFDKEYPRRKVALPTYPFQRQRYWVDVAKPRHTAALRPLIDKMTQSPLLKELLFETEFSLDALPFLADHRVYGEVVSPGACQLAMTLNAAALALRQEYSLQVADVVWPQALVIPAQKKQTVQALLRPEAANGHSPHYSVQLVSFAADETISSETTTSTHLTGRVMMDALHLDAVVDLAALRQRCNQSLDVKAFYNQLEATQITLGPGFRWIQSLWCTQKQSAISMGQEVLAQFFCPETMQTTGHLLHPALLDACFQVTGATYTQNQERETLLPFALDSIQLHRAATGSRWWCHATQVEEQRWDIQLLGESGEVIATLTGFTVRPATAAVIQGENRWRNWLYTVAWEAQPRPQSTPQEMAALAGQRWLLFADRKGVGAALATQLRQTGATPVLVYADADVTQPWLHADSDTYYLHPTQAEHYAMLLAEITSAAPLHGVIHLWSLDALPVTQAMDLAAATRLGCDAVLPLVQALVGQTGQTARLWLVTQGAQALQPGAAVAGLGQAPLWGMGKVIALEHPELAPVCVDVDGAHASADDCVAIAHQLLMEVGAAAAQHPHEAQIVWRKQQRYVARLVRYQAAVLPHTDRAAHGAKPAITPAPLIHKTAAYLITGGLRGLGLAVAEWLVAQGAEYLILMGRSQPTPTVQTQVAAFRAAGVQVIIAQADVTDPAQVAQLLNQLDPAYPLRGIVHAAGVLDDGALLQQNRARFAKVLAAKVQGTWHLHEASKEMALDFFVLFSSVASLLGNRGQANYAAANAFLDAFAYYRQAQGLPALSINWGGWAEIGQAAQLMAKHPQQSAAHGLGSIAPTQGIAAFAALIRQSMAQVGVVPLTWPRYYQAAGRSDAFFAHFVDPVVTEPTATAGRAAQDAARLREQLAQAAVGERSTLVTRQVQQVVAQILGMPQLPPLQVGFNQMGLDSLMALALKKQLETMWQLALPATVAFQFPTVEELANYLIGQLFPAAATTAALPTAGLPSTPPATPDPTPLLSGEALLAFIDQEFEQAFQ